MRETGRKIEGKTGQMTELSNVWKTVWKIEGMTEETDRSEPGQSPLREPPRGTAMRTAKNSFRRTLVRTGRGR